MKLWFIYHLVLIKVRHFDGFLKGRQISTFQFQHELKHSNYNNKKNIKIWYLILPCFPIPQQSVVEFIKTLRIIIFRQYNEQIKYPRIPFAIKDDYILTQNCWALMYRKNTFYMHAIIIYVLYCI